MKYRLLLFSIFFSFIACYAKANTKGNPGINEVNDASRKNDVAGGVTHAESRKPLSNVSVTAYSSSKKEKVVLTDGNGYYAFSDLKPGTYRLVFEKDGYKKVTKDKVIIRSEEGCQLNIAMFEDEGFQIMPGQLIFSDF
jgi:hypothetical protein